MKVYSILIPCDNNKYEYVTVFEDHLVKNKILFYSILCIFPFKISFQEMYIPAICFKLYSITQIKCSYKLHLI